MPAPLPAISRWIPLLATFCLALGLASCSPGDAGSVKYTQVDHQKLENGPLVSIVRLEVDSFTSGVWERVLFLRERRDVAVTPLVRATRVACTGPRTCRITLLPPGDLWPTTYEVDPTRFYPPDVEVEDLGRLGRGWSVPLQADRTFEGRSGLKPVGHDWIGEATLVATFAQRQFVREWPVAPAAFWTTLVLFVVCWGISALVRRVWPNSTLAGWSRRWPCDRKVVQGCYIFAMLAAAAPFVAAFADGPGARGVQRPGLLGGTFIQLQGASPLEPLIMLVAALGGILVFDLISRAIRLAVKARQEPPKDSADAQG